MPRLPTRRALWALLVLLAAILGGCSAAPNAHATPTPSGSAAADVALPDYNSRLGSNRLAAEAAARMGRRLYSHSQFWEVYVRTQPASLPGVYDPADPAASAPAATQVTAADMIMATESGAAIKAFSQGGDPQERAQLTELFNVLREVFPGIGGATMKIFYGESFQHGTATFQGGRLVTYDVRKLG